MSAPTASADPTLRGQAPVSPVAARIQVDSRTQQGLTAEARVEISAAEPVFDGHYPGFPIFPGVCVLDCAYRAAVDGAAGLGLHTLTAVESARFARPVRPGDTITLTLSWRTGREMACSVRAATEGKRIAMFRLRFADDATGVGAVCGPGDSAVPLDPSGGDAALPSVPDLLPHRYPMLLVDRVRAWEPGSRISAVKSITLNEPWYRDTGPGTATAYPPSLLIESWGQAAGVLALAGGTVLPEGQVMLLGSAADAEFGAPVHPGETLEHRVRTSRVLSDSVIFEGSSHRTDGTPVMTVGRMVMAFRPAGQLSGRDSPQPRSGDSSSIVHTSREALR